MNLWCTSLVSLLSHDCCTLLVLCFCSFDNQYLPTTGLSHSPAPGVRWGNGTAGLLPPAPSCLKSRSAGCCPSNRPTRDVAPGGWISSFLAKPGLTTPLFREARGSRRGRMSFRSKIALEKRGSRCPCFLLTPLGN